MPHHDSEHSDYALMVRDRPPTTYLWQRAPTLLKVKLLYMSDSGHGLTKLHDYCVLILY